MAAGKLEIWGSEVTMNLENILLINIQSSPYFKELYALKTYNEVIQQIASEVKNLEPWLNPSAKTPSTAFCLLYKLFTLKLTVKQMMGMLNHKESAFVRGLGFLYLRYSSPPKELWEWYVDYLDDPSPIALRGNKAQPTTIGRFVRDLMTEQKYFDTILPRIPVPVMKEIQQNLKEYDIEMGTYNDNNNNNNSNGYGRDEDGGGDARKRKRSSSRDRDYRDRDRDRDYRDKDRDRDRDRRDYRDNRGGRDYRDRDRDRDYDRDRNRERERDRDRDRRGNRSRSRDREQRRRRSRSTSRDRHTSKSYKRDSRSRSRSRDRGGDRHRSNRSRSRSRSRSVRRSRSRSPAKTAAASSSSSSAPSASTTSTTTAQRSASNANLEKLKAMYGATTSTRMDSDEIQSRDISSSETIILGLRKHAK